MKVLTPILVGIGILLSGCGTVTEVVRLNDQVLEERPPNSEMPIITGKPDRPYQEIAIIEVKKTSWIPFRPPSSYRLHTRMKVKAAKLGADALILVEYEQDRLRATTTAQGTAVKFTD